MKCRKWKIDKETRRNGLEKPSRFELRWRRWWRVTKPSVVVLVQVVVVGIGLLGVDCGREEEKKGGSLGLGAEKSKR
jgi:hypothetical protein